jgi:hypothetical protein
MPGDLSVVVDIVVNIVLAVEKCFVAAVKSN